MDSIPARFRKIFLSDAFSYGCILLYALIFVLARYPFYRYFPVPLAVVADGADYYRVYNEMLRGTAHFDIITPGYPFFIYIVHEFFSEKGIALYLGHSVITLLASLFFLFTIKRYYRQCLPPAALALILYLCQDSALRFETATFPQALMVATGFFFFAFTIRVLHRPNHVSMFLLSVSAVYMITLKSSQMFMLPLVGLLLAYFFILNKKNVALWICAYTAFPLLVYAGYNYMTFKQFTVISPGILDAEAQKQRIFSKQEQDFFYKIGAHLPAWHPITWIHHSNDLDSLQSAYLTCRWGTYLEKDSSSSALLLRVLFEMDQTVNIDSLLAANTAFSPEERNWYAQNKDSITDFPINFYPRSGSRKLKIYVLNYLLNIKRNAPLFYYSEIKWRYENFYITRAWAKRYDLTNPKVSEDIARVLREMYDPPLRNMKQFEAEYAQMKDDFFFKLYDIANSGFIRPFARSVLWLYLYIFITLAAAIAFLLNFRNGNLAFLLVLSLFHLGSCLLYSIWGDPISRYSYATEMVPYLLLAFFPLLFSKQNRQR